METEPMMEPVDNDLLSTASDIYCNSRESDGSWDIHSEKQECHSKYLCNFGRLDDQSQLLNAIESELDILGFISPKDGAFQLSKSTNPYLPSHSYKDGVFKIEASCTFGRPNPIGKVDCCSQEETFSKKHNIAHAKHPEIKDPSDPEIKETANISCCDMQRGDLLEYDTDKVNKSITQPVLSCEDTGTISNHHVGVGLKDKGGYTLFPNIEKSVPLFFAARDSDKSLLSMDAIIGDTKANQSLQPVSMRKELEQSISPFSIYEDSLDIVAESNTSEPCQFPFVYGSGDVLPSLLVERKMIDSDHHCLPSKKPGAFELSKLEEDGFSFEDMWDEISEILLSDQELQPIPLVSHEVSDDSLISIGHQTKRELDRTPVAANKNAVDSEVYPCLPNEGCLVSIDHLMNTKSDPIPVAGYKDAVDLEVDVCLPDEDSLISIDYQINTAFNQVENTVDIADPEAEISLPEEDSLITIEDLIARHCSKCTCIELSEKANQLRSSVESEVSKKQSAGLYFLDADEGSAATNEKIHSFIDKASLLTEEQSFPFQSDSPKPCSGCSTPNYKSSFKDQKFNPDKYCSCFSDTADRYLLPTGNRNC